MYSTISWGFNLEKRKESEGKKGKEGVLKFKVGRKKKKVGKKTSDFWAKNLLLTFEKKVREKKSRSFFFLLFSL